MSSIDNINRYNILKSLSKHSLVYGISTALQPFAGFILLPLYSQYFEKSEYGSYSLIITISTIFSIIFQFGINSAFTRSYFDYEDEDARVRVFNTALCILILGFITQLIVGLFVTSLISIHILNSNKYEFILYISIITSAFSFLNTGIFNNLRVKNLSVKYSLLSVFSFVTNVIFVLLLFEYHKKSIESPIYATLLSQLLTFIILIFINIKDINLLRVNTRKFLYF